MQEPCRLPRIDPVGEVFFLFGQVADFDAALAVEPLPRDVARAQRFFRRWMRRFFLRIALVAQGFDIGAKETVRRDFERFLIGEQFPRMDESEQRFFADAQNLLRGATVYHDAVGRRFGGRGLASGVFAFPVEVPQNAMRFAGDGFYVLDSMPVFAGRSVSGQSPVVDEITDGSLCDAEERRGLLRGKSRHRFDFGGVLCWLPYFAPFVKISFLIYSASKTGFYAWSEIFLRSV